MFDAGVKDQAPYKVVADFLHVLPEIKAMGRSLSAGQPSNQIRRLVGEDKTGGGNGGLWSRDWQGQRMQCFLRVGHLPDSNPDSSKQTVGLP